MTGYAAALSVGAWLHMKRGPRQGAALVFFALPVGWGWRDDRQDAWD